MLRSHNSFKNMAIEKHLNNTTFSFSHVPDSVHRVPVEYGPASAHYGDLFGPILSTWTSTRVFKDVPSPLR